MTRTFRVSAEVDGRVVEFVLTVEKARLNHADAVQILRVLYPNGLRFEDVEIEVVI